MNAEIFVLSGQLYLINSKCKRVKTYTRNLQVTTDQKKNKLPERIANASVRLA